MLPDPIELPEQRAVFFPELVGRGPPPPAPPLASRPPALMPPPLPVAPPPVAAPDDDDLSVASASSAAFGIQSSTTSFSASAPPFESTSKFWGVSWDKNGRRWMATYTDANGKKRYIGLYDTQEAAAHAVNAAIRRAGLEGKRRTNPVVDGRLMPRKTHKRRRDEPAASSSRGRRRR